MGFTGVSEDSPCSGWVGTGEATGGTIRQKSFFLMLKMFPRTFNPLNSGLFFKFSLEIFYIL